MDRREKEARLQSLKKLQQRRRHKDEPEEDNEEPTEASESSELGDEGLSDFIEDDAGDCSNAEEENDGNEAQSTKKPRLGAPSMSTFFKKAKPTRSSTSSSIAKEPGRAQASAALKDSFFQNLVAQLDEDEEEDKEESSNDKTARLKPQDHPGQLASSLAASSSGTASVSEAADLTSCFPEVTFKTPSAGLLNLALDVENTDALLCDDQDDDWCNEEELQGIEAQMQDTSIQVLPQTASNPPAIECKAPPAPAQIPFAETRQMSIVADDFPDSADCEYMYWFDAYEKQPNGPVYLFGKLRDRASPDGLATCCLILDGLKRNVFFLPREDASAEDLQAEVSELVQNYGIAKFGCKRVTRKYAFELAQVPSTSEYLKLVYPFANGAQLPSTLSGKTFSRVFGTGTSALELFLIKRRIMGPCWLKISSGPGGARKTGRSVSWCKHELTLSDIKKVSVAAAGDSSDPIWAAPPLTALALSLRTVINPETRAHEIVAVSGLFYPNAEISGGQSSGDANAARPKCSAAFTVLRDPSDVGFTAKFTEAFTGASSPGTGRQIKVEIVKTEKALLNYVIALLTRFDPDFLIGHNFWGFDLGVLLARLRAAKVDGWSKIGRLNWSQWPKGKGSSTSNGGITEASWAERQLVSGRLVCDTYLTAKDLVKAKNYTLSTLTESLLGLSRAPFDSERTRDAFDKPESLAALLTANEMDAFYMASLMFAMQVLPLTLQLTQIAGNLWSRTLVGARAERNEFLLLHEFHDLKFICPDRQAYFKEQPLSLAAEADDEEGNAPQQTKGSRRKPQYAGGLVLEPKKGLYDRIVLLLDFNSLYPSIIQEYNICFTTVVRGEEDASKKGGEDEHGDDLPPVPDAALPVGVLPRILKTLVERRRAVKSLMKNRDKLSPGQYAAYNVRQQALKLTANSMYGCLGFAHSRFYAKPLAMLITAKGREILQNTVTLTRDVCQLDVIYGDTDSIMVNTRTSNMAEARAFGLKVKKAVNERYRLLEIELDGIFQRLLLLKKKKYAALVVEEEHADGKLATKLETKGLDLVRRDWCELSVDASKAILEAIMYKESGDTVVESIHEGLRSVARDLQAGTIPLEKFIISKSLTKDPAAYADAKNQPHVTVALRMRKRGLTAASGDTIPYVICLQSQSQENSSGLADCAYHPDEVRKDPSLKIDQLWYLQTQLHPPIARLCEHLEGTDSARLASCLGLDPKKFRAYSSSSAANGESDGLIGGIKFSTLLSDEERFANVEKLQFCCPNCRDTFQFTGVAREQQDENDPAGAQGSAVKVGMDCTNCKHRLSVPALYYSVQESLRRASDRYHSYWMRCDEMECGLETERIGVYDRRCPQDGCKGNLRSVLPASYLYTHLLYLRSLFAPDKVIGKLSSKLSMPETKMLQQLGQEVEPIRAFIEEQLRQCAYPVIDFKTIFSYLLK